MTQIKRYRSASLLTAILIATLVFTGCAGGKKAPDQRQEPDVEKPTLYTLELGDTDVRDVLLTVAPGEIYDAASGEKVDFERMIDELAEADVIYLGESHTSMNIHQFQARVIEALAERGRQLIIGMEFFYRNQEAVLADWVAGNLGEEEFVRAGQWYSSGGYNFGYYAPILNAAREHGFPVVGINIDRMIIRAISRGGLESLDEEQSAQVGEVDLTNPEHRKLIMFYFGGAAMTHGMDEDEEEARQRLDRMYAAQSAWDQVFADSAKAALEKFDGIFVTIVGSGHVAYGLGANRRLEETSDYQAVTVYPVLTESEKAETVRASIGDFIVGFEDDMDPAYFPAFGISARDHAGLIVTGMLFPGSLAKEAGLEQEDVILALDGEELDNVEDLRIRLADKEWGEKTILTVRRDGEVMEIDITPEK